MKNKTAIVTGASSGLGKAVSERLSQMGVNVLGFARTATKSKFSKNIVPIDCNIRDIKDIDNAFKKIFQSNIKVDFLINCAGRGLVKRFEDVSRDEIMDVLGINLKGNIYIALETYKHMIKNQSGHIINVGSTSSIKARELETIYCASKWGLRGFTESLRLEAKAHGIKVTGVYPGGMQSENFWQIIPGKDISNFMPTEKIAEQIIAVLESASELSIAELVIERP